MHSSQKARLFAMDELEQDLVYSKLLDWLKSRGWNQHGLGTIKMLISENLSEYTRCHASYKAGLELLDELLLCELAQHTPWIALDRDDHGVLCTQAVWAGFFPTE